MSNASSSERRRNRSHVPEEAVRRYLEALAFSRGMKALVIADDDGRVVGVGQADVDLARLAAAGRLCARGIDPGAELEDVCDDEDLYAHAWTAEGRSFTLVSLGARVPRVRDVQCAVQRIADGMHA